MGILTLGVSSDVVLCQSCPAMLGAARMEICMDFLKGKDCGPVEQRL